MSKSTNRLDYIASFEVCHRCAQLYAQVCTQLCCQNYCWYKATKRHSYTTFSFLVSRFFGAAILQLSGFRPRSFSGAISCCVKLCFLSNRIKLAKTFNIHIHYWWFMHKVICKLSLNYLFSFHFCSSNQMIFFNFIVKKLVFILRLFKIQE